MSLTALKIAWDHLNSAQLWQLGENMVLNPLRHNCTDFIRTSIHANNHLLLVDGTTEDCGGDAVLKLNRVTANADAIYFAGGGAVAANDVFVVSFLARASEATTLTVAIATSYDGDAHTAAATASVTTVWRRHTIRLVASALKECPNSSLLKFSLASGTSDLWFYDIKCWKVVSTETLPRFQSCNIGSKVSHDLMTAYDQSASRSTDLVDGETDVTFVDPYIDSDPAWWLDKMNARGRQWAAGEQYFDGDFVEDATSYWTAQSATVAWTAQYPIIGTKSVSVANGGGGADPYAARRVTLTCSSRRFVASVWCTPAVGSAYVATAPLSIYDGTTDHGANVYTMSSALPMLIKEEFTAAKGATYLEPRLHGAVTTTDSLLYDGFKIEPAEYTPFVPQRNTHLWALYLRFTDTTYYYHLLVPRLRFSVNQQQMQISSFLYDAIRATGDQTLRWRETR